MRGAVRIEKNPLLCHANTIDWQAIAHNADPDAHFIKVTCLLRSKFLTRKSSLTYRFRLFPGQPRPKKLRFLSVELPNLSGFFGQTQTRLDGRSTSLLDQFAVPTK